MRRELAFTAFNRVDYIRDVVDSWNNVRRLDNWTAHFYIEPSPVQTFVTDAANDLDTGVVAHFNENLQGVLINPWNAINNRFEDGCDFVVLAEDDVVVSSDALEYLEWASEEYKDDNEILMINLFSQMGGPKEDQVIRQGFFSPLIWGTWRNRWETILRDTWDKNYSSGNPDGSEAGWDWNINRILTAKKLQVIRPLHSRSDHIGEWGGTHMTSELFHTSRGTAFKQNRGRQVYVEVD
jgi:hypothetical protein